MIKLFTGRDAKNVKQDDRKTNDQILVLQQQIKDVCSERDHALTESESLKTQLVTAQNETNTAVIQRDHALAETKRVQDQLELAEHKLKQLKKNRQHLPILPKDATPDHASAEVTTTTEHSDAVTQQLSRITQLNQSLSMVETLLQALPYAMTGQLDYSIDLFTKAIDMQPESSYVIYALTLRSYMYQKKENYKQAIEDLNQAIQHKPDFTWALSGLGLCYEHQNKEEDAIGVYTTCIEKDDNFVFPLKRRCRLYYKRGERDRAIKDCNKALLLNDKDWELQQFRKQLFASKERSVTESHRPMMAIHPLLTRNDVISSIERGDDESAIKILNEVITQIPQDAELYNNRGATYERLGLLKNALEDYEYASKLGLKIAASNLKRLLRRPLILRTSVKKFDKSKKSGFVELPWGNREAYLPRWALKEIDRDRTGLVQGMVLFCTVILNERGPQVDHIIDVMPYMRTYRPRAEVMTDPSENPLPLAVGTSHKQEP